MWGGYIDRITGTTTDIGGRIGVWLLQPIINSQLIKIAPSETWCTQTQKDRHTHTRTVCTCRHESAWSRLCDNILP